MKLTAILTLTCLISITATTAQAIDINWFSIDSGGTSNSSGGEFQLAGTIGQPDAGVLSGGEFELIGGYHAAAASTAPCVGDLDGDNQIGLSDLAVLLANFGTAMGALPEDGDLDLDGDVDLSDLAALLAAFGTVCS